MGADRKPPRLAATLLRLTLPARARDSLVGDLEEEWRRRRDRGVATRAWYWRQAVSLIAGYGGRTWLGALGEAWGASRRGWAADLLGAARHVARDRRFTLAAAALLAAGIGVSSALFSVVYAVLLAPLPYAEPERLVRIWETHTGSGVEAGAVAPGNFLDFQERAGTLALAATGYATEAALTDGEPVETILVGEVTADFFAVLGVTPVLGRGFDADDARAAWVDNAGRFRGPARIVLSEGLWRTRYGADPRIVGSTIGVNGQAVTVIGVMPDRLRLPEAVVRAWVAWDMRVGYGDGSAGAPPRNSRFTTAVARLAGGVEIDAARLEVAEIATALGRDHPETNAGWSATVEPLHDAVVGDARRPLSLLSASVTLLMLGVGITLAGMQTVRGAARGREGALRSALGAGRARLARQLLLESLFLGGLGSAAGLATGALLLPVVLARLPADLPRGVENTLHPLPMLAAVVLGITVAAVSGLVPAWRSAAGGAARLRAREAPRRGAGAPLVVIEVALAVILVASTGLLARSLGRLLSEDPGFRAEQVLTARLNLEANVSGAAVRRVGFFDALLETIRDEPGVIAAGGATFLPMTEVGPYFDRPYWRQGEPAAGGNAPRGWIRIVTPGFLESLRVPLLSGRAFDAEDRFAYDDPERGGDAPRVAIVNRTLAAATWPDEDPVGKVLVMDYPVRVYEYTVVGVVGDVLPEALGRPAPPEIYLPYGQIPYPGLTLAIRTRDDPALFEPRLRALVARANPLQPVDRVAPLADRVAATTTRERFVLGVVGAFGAAALALAALGLYGVVNLLVQGARQEMGVRLALGARPSQVRAAVLGQAGRLCAAGIVLGLAGTFAATTWIASSLHRISPLDPFALGATAAVVATSCLVAAWIPAARATRIDPSEALRGD